MPSNKYCFFNPFSVTGAALRGEKTRRKKPCIIKMIETNLGFRTGANVVAESMNGHTTQRD